MMLVHVICAFQSLLFAQTPQGFNYQAVARDTDGAPLAQTALTIRIGILSESATSPLVWGEEHPVVTNVFIIKKNRKLSRLFLKLGLSYSHFWISTMFPSGSVA